jgi:CelD/BcsL family acetyltransferase involved in cellulose biosynthesis
MRIATLAAGDRDRAGAIWEAVEATLPAPRLTISWLWTRTWLEHYGDVVAHRFLVGEPDGGGEPVGIALVCDGVLLPPARLRPRTVHLGTAGEPHGETAWVERNGLVAVPGEQSAFAAALLGALRDAGGWDRLQLDGFHLDDLARFTAAEPDLEVDTLETPIADLGGGFDDDGALAALSGSARRRVRQTLRAFGELECEWAADVPRALEILDELADLHQARRTAAGDAGAFASARFTAFHRALIERLGPERAMLVRARRAGETVGCLYGHVEGDRLLFYQSGVRHYEDNKLRAGVAVHALAMQACAQRGITTYDFLAPPDRYKRELATDAQQLAWARLERRTPRTLLASAQRRLRRRAQP